MRPAQLAAGSAAQWLPVAAHALARCTQQQCNVFRRAVLSARGPVYLSCPLSSPTRASARHGHGSTAGSAVRRPPAPATIVARASADGRVRIELRPAGPAAPAVRRRSTGRGPAGRAAQPRPAVGGPRSAAGRGLRMIAAAGPRHTVVVRRPGPTRLRPPA